MHGVSVGKYGVTCAYTCMDCTCQYTYYSSLQLVLPHYSTTILQYSSLQCSSLLYSSLQLVLPHYSTTKLQYSSLQYSSLQHYHTTVPPHYSTTTLQYHHTTVPPHYSTTSLQYSSLQYSSLQYSSLYCAVLVTLWNYSSFILFLF